MVAPVYMGLLKAAVIASGLVPPAMEGSAEPLGDLLSRLAGPGRGLEQGHGSSAREDTQIAGATALDPAPRPPDEEERPIGLTDNGRPVVPQR